MNVALVRPHRKIARNVPYYCEKNDKNGENPLNRMAEIITRAVLHDDGQKLIEKLTSL